MSLQNQSLAMEVKTLTCEQIFLRDSQKKIVACAVTDPFLFQINDSNELPRFVISRKDGEHPVFSILEPGGHARFHLAFVDETMHLYSGGLFGSPLAKLKYDQKDNTIHIQGSVNVIHRPLEE